MAQKNKFIQIIPGFTQSNNVGVGTEYAASKEPIDGVNTPNSGTMVTHAHKNKTVLDALDERDGLLTYNGQTIKSGDEERIQSDWTEQDPTSPAYVLNKPELKPVATTGDFSDLQNVPVIARKISQLINDSGFINRTVNNLVNYYTKSELMTAEEINELVANVGKLDAKIVAVLPDENISTSTIYLVKDGDSNIYQQYMYINGVWSSLGRTTIDLTNYYTSAQVDSRLNKKVEKEIGKGLSSNDFTDAYKSIIDELSLVATSGKYSDLTGKPSIPQSSADLSDASSLAKKQDLHTHTNMDVLKKLSVDVVTGKLFFDGAPISGVVDDLVNYYKKNETYSKSEVNQMISLLNKLDAKIVTSLPSENISTSTIYLIKNTGDAYNQWMYINGQWSEIGSTSISIANFYNKDEIDFMMLDKVDAVPGKVLSTNDFTNEYKAKVDGIANYGDQIEELRTTKVDSEIGKGLSSNDYTDEDKAKVDAAGGFEERIADLETGKVDSEIGKGLSSNDFTSDYKNKIDALNGVADQVSEFATKVSDVEAALGNKVNTEVGKGLSTNDFTNEYKAKLDDLNGATTDISDLNQAVTELNSALNDKVEKETGKGLSTNDFTNAYKTKLDGFDEVSNKVNDVELSVTNLSTTVGSKADKSSIQNFTLASGSWSGNNYTITLVDKDKYPIALLSHPILTSEQSDALAAAQIEVASETTTTVTLVARGTKPTINIPITFILQN